MCGIFGFMLSKPQKVTLASDVLKLLETHQYPGEKQPVGGHGAGMYYVDSDRVEVFTKVGKSTGSPAEAFENVFATIPNQTAHLTCETNKS
jgi:glutamate synthase domain-containing protein 1